MESLRRGYDVSDYILLLFQKTNQNQDVRKAHYFLLNLECDQVTLDELKSTAEAIGKIH